MMNVFIVAAKRTPFGNFGGKLKNMTATQLGVHAAKAAVAESKIDPSIIDSTIIGNVAQTSSDASYMARHVGLGAGAPIASTALTVNRLCGSGFQSIVSGTQEIQLGESKVALVGGAESMSQAPMAAYGHKVRFGTALGKDLGLVDTLWAGLTDQYCKTPMGVTAENLAEQYDLTRDVVDAYGHRSQQAWAAANAAGAFKDEIAPMEVKGRKGVETFDTDEGPRPQTTLEQLGKLPTVFKKDGAVTAGTASGITDGAAALVLAGEESVKEHGMTPLARVVSWGIAGVDPTVMGIGPVPAYRQALARAGLSLDDMDLCEVNEAFGAQYLAVEKELGLDREKTNVCGGAIALGHPLGASGARIMAHLTHRLIATDGKYAIGGACIGGGQGIAVVIERV